MSEIRLLSRAEFDEVYSKIKPSLELDVDFLYHAYEEANEAAKELIETGPFGKLTTINPVILILYIVNEHFYFVANNPTADFAALCHDEKYLTAIVSMSLDKYFTNEHLAFHKTSFANRYLPPISTLNVYLNFILGMLSRYNKFNPSETLVVDIMNKGFSMGKAILDLLVNGFETEAFSTWRTLHETECILTVITKYGEPVIKEYLKHMDYATAFRGGYFSKEETDKIFINIKEEMRTLDLKSKDMKRFIEYGWLLGVPDVMQIPDFKFNFRDGVERVALLSQYSDTYEMSSEIAHSSPLLIYSKRDYFYVLTLLNLYESFFRLEKIFSSIYLQNVNDDEKNKYEIMRKMYFAQLMSIYQVEKSHFIALNQKH